MGGSQSAENRVLLHPECHDRVHHQCISVSKRVSPKEAFEGLELCERKLSCTVLRGLDGSNPSGYSVTRERFSDLIPCTLFPQRPQYPKVPALFAGFGRHPNSCERTLKEVRHNVQVGIWAEFALIFHSGQRQH